VRCAGAESVAAVGRSDGEGDGEAYDACGRAEGGLEDERAFAVPAMHLGVADGSNREVAGVGTEQTTEDRR